MRCTTPVDGSVRVSRGTGGPCRNRRGPRPPQQWTQGTACAKKNFFLGGVRLYFHGVPFLWRQISEPHYWDELKSYPRRKKYPCSANRVFCRKDEQEKKHQQWRELAGLKSKTGHRSLYPKNEFEAGQQQPTLPIRCSHGVV
jgi:hypothetical protein